MLLEDLGVKKEVFLDLLDRSVADARLACDDIEKFVHLLRKHNLGSWFGFSRTVQKLSLPPFNLKFNPSTAQTNLRSPFVDELIYCAVGKVLRDIQYKCRIQVPDSWHLVGVIDEGVSWIERRVYKPDQVCTLNKGEIFGQRMLQIFKSRIPG